MSAPCLSYQTLALLADSVARRDIKPDRLMTGICHLGLGAFARAHLASYTDPLLDTAPSWGICGISLRSPSTRNALAPQDWLYLRAERDGSGEQLRAMGALTGALVAPEDPSIVIERLAQPSTRIVTISVSEKGYHRRASDGALDEDDLAIRHDLARPDRPLTVPGIVVASLNARRNAGVSPFTVLCCDNLPENGASTRRVVLRFAEMLSPDLARYIADAVSFPNSMVDRIVPATTEMDKSRIAVESRVVDAWPVVCEPFTQWVIEDHFPQRRPAWNLTGATMVSDVRPYETMKLRLLNGSHSAIAYLGQLAGLPTVADAMREPALVQFIADLMMEAAATLRMPPTLDLASYGQALLERFRNPALRHRTAQIAMDGSQKLPMRIFATALDRIANGQAAPCMALVTAAWLHFLQQRDDNGSPLTVDDPNKDKLLKAARNADTPQSLMKQVFAMSDIVPAALAASDAFEGEVLDALMMLSVSGARATLEMFNHREEKHENRNQGTNRDLFAGGIAARSRAGTTGAR
jgi:fructuronate reductase